MTTDIPIILFYKNIKVPSFEHTYEEVLTELEGNSTFLAQLRTNPNFLGLAFPTLGMVKANVDFSLLFIDKELTTRVFSLYVMILHRLGIKLYDAPTGRFEWLTMKDGFAEIVPDDIFKSKVAIQENGIILELILRAFPLMGFMNCATYIHNAIYKRIIRTEVDPFARNEWFNKSRLANITEDLIYLEENRKDDLEAKTTPLIPFTDWILGWRALAFKAGLKSVHTAEDVIAHKQKAINHQQKDGPRNVINMCEHGVYMRPAQQPGSTRKKFVCVIQAQSPSNPAACDKEYPCLAN